MKLKELLDDLIELIKTQVSDFNLLPADKAAYLVREYNNEFSSDGEWTPSFPTCFVELTNFTPGIFNNKLDLLKGSSAFVLYVGAGFKPGNTHVLNIVGRICEAVSIGTSTIEGIEFKFKLGPINLLGKDKVIKVYTIQVLAI